MLELPKPFSIPIPFDNPIRVASTLIKNRDLYTSVIRSCDLVLSQDPSILNHPLYLMYRGHLEWLNAFTQVLVHFKENRPLQAHLFSLKCLSLSPEFLTNTLFDHYKSRLFTFDPESFSEFRDLGTSYAEWYIIYDDLKGKFQTWVYTDGGFSYIL